MRAAVRSSDVAGWARAFLAGLNDEGSNDAS